MLPHAVVDDDTGLEIIAFKRYGRYYFYLRDPVTKRFIKRIDRVNVKCTVAIDYRSLRRYYHSIYVDTNVKFDVKPENWEYLDRIEEALALHGKEAINRDFGSALLSFMTKPKFSYHSKQLTYSDVYAHIHMIWHHYDSKNRPTLKKKKFDMVVFRW
jgi:hypothetical protein